jgi:hypothetical protein
MSKCIKCGSYAFNLHKDDIDQGALCDVHYWQGRAHRAENKQEQGEPVQEPLFWYKPYPGGMYNGPIHNAQIGDILRGSEEWAPLYTKPQQRTWVGLTIEDQKIIADSSAANNWNDWQMMDAIEAKLKDKNT